MIKEATDFADCTDKSKRKKASSKVPKDDFFKSKNGIGYIFQPRG